MKLSRLNDTVWAKLAPSDIHGIGVFAIRDIPSGTVYTDYGQFCGYDRESCDFSEDEMEELVSEVKELVMDRTLLTSNTKSVYSPNSDADLRAFMNHSDTPNTDGVVTLVDIKKGEELTENYLDVSPGSVLKAQRKYYNFIKEI